LITSSNGDRLGAFYTLTRSTMQSISRGLDRFGRIFYRLDRLHRLAGETGKTTCSFWKQRICVCPSVHGFLFCSVFTELFFCL